MKNGRNGSFGLILVLISTLPGCAAEKELPQQAKAILSKVSEFTLYSLEPHEKADKTNSLHGEKVLGKTMVKDAAVRKQLLSTLEKSIAKPEKGGAKCFWPRHAIRATHEGKTVDVPICFECGWVYVYLDNEDAIRIQMDTAGQEPFDDVLRKAKVPLAKKREDFGLAKHVVKRLLAGSVHLDANGISVIEVNVHPATLEANEHIHRFTFMRRTDRVAGPKTLCSSFFRLGDALLQR